MSKPSAETIRKAALIEAAIATVGRAGTLEVTVAEIARAAGMSSALAHHYFGSKEQMLLAAMRAILARFGQTARIESATARTPRERLDAILRASFGPENFEHATIAAWLAFYALARSSPEAARLLAVYHARLRSNLLFSLRQFPCVADSVAARFGALIDGIYLRAALSAAPDGQAALALARGYLDEAISPSATSSATTPPPGESTFIAPATAATAATRKAHVD